jgi:hypothetical protein
MMNKEVAMLVQKLEPRGKGLYALVLPEEAFRLVGIDPGLEVRIVPQAGGILVSSMATALEPPVVELPVVKGFEHADLADPAVSVDLLRQLLKQGLQPSHFHRLHHFREKAAAPTHLDYCEGLVKKRSRFRTRPNQDVARRMLVCLGELREGRPWDRAIARALAAAPLDA